MITSHQNPKVKRALALRKSSERRKSGRFLIDGVTEVQLAVAHGIAIDSFFYTSEDTRLPSVPSERCWRVSPEILAKLSYGQTGAQPVAIASTPSRSLEQLHLTSQSLVLVLDRTEKPGNLGACLRTASASGVTAVVLTDPICELHNPNTIRASRGTVFSLPVCVTHADAFRTHCRKLGLPIYCAVVEATRSLWSLDLRSGAALVFGNEATGLDRVQWLASAPSNAAGAGFSIPMVGAADSLNLSNSAAIVLYEAFRQRTDASGNLTR